MFTCSKCGKAMIMPKCSFCGNTVTQTNNVWQLTDEPDIVTDGDGDKYIGYEYIGENYSGNRKYLIEERDEKIAEYISSVTGNGVFLDIGCGDGSITVPCAKLGIRTVAGDISNTMLGILQERAKRNDISLENVTLCRLNALQIPLENESVDCVIANSVLHLISNPQKVLNEIYRVLKRGGRFVCQDDIPGKNTPTQNNELYMQIVHELSNTYWSELNKLGITAKRYSWRFDREAACKEIFSSKETKHIERGNRYFNPFKDCFLPRFAGRGFSDQVDVPQDIHTVVMEKVMAALEEKYGADTLDTVGHSGIEDDILITAYVKG